MDRVEERLNVASGERTGIKQTGDDTKALWAVGISIGGVLITIALTVIGFFRK